jgi:sugar phosphate isomerase/epimerase
MVFNSGAEGGNDVQNRRDFLKKTLGAAALGAAIEDGTAMAADGLAWTKPIGLELYTVRHLFAKTPKETLKDVADAGYREVEAAVFLPMNLSEADFKRAITADGLANPSGFVDMPKTTDDWKKSVEQAHGFGWKYMVTGYTDRADADGWKRLADLFNQCGKLSQAAGIQFCYHNHIREFEKLGSTIGYDILLENCEPALMKMEMDIFWITYSGFDPLPYFKSYPGRFPLLHIKDMKKDAVGSTMKFPSDSGPNPFAAVGQGKIDWAKIFAHAGEAGAKHIFVEQDRSDVPPLEAIKISFDYLRTLRLS